MNVVKWWLESVILNWLLSGSQTVFPMCQNERMYFFLQISEHPWHILLLLLHIFNFKEKARHIKYI